MRKQRGGNRIFLRSARSVANKHCNAQMQRRSQTWKFDEFATAVG